MSLAEDVPVHAPVVRAPVAGLRGGLGGLVDAAGTMLVFPKYTRVRLLFVPDSSCLQLDGRAGKDCGGQDLVVLAAVKDTLGDGGVCAIGRYQPEFLQPSFHSASPDLISLREGALKRTR